jgi:hypothetical protein
MVIVPPNFVWMHLFPADVSYTCQGPVWLQDALRPHGHDASRTVLVTSGGSATSLPDLERHEGIAAINCRGLSAERLRLAGFQYVRRFAILPDAGDVRWLIPLDSPAVSVASFHLFAAVRLASRIKHFLARAAAGAGIPLWYRDEICVAQRNVPPLAAALESVFRGRTIALALSSGAPGPLERRKPTMAVVDASGHILAFAKLAVSPISNGLVRHETSVLEGLPLAAPGTGAPRVIFAGEVDGKFALVQTPISGSPPGPRLTQAHHEFLATLRRSERKPLSGTSWGKALKRRIMAPTASDRDLVRVYQTSMEVLNGKLLPVAVVHGDFVPWNLRQRHGALAACDWENGSLEGVALVDEIHHRLVVGHLVGKWSVERARQEMAALALTRPVGMAPGDVTAIAITCAVEFMLRLIDHGHTESHPMVAWYRQLASCIHGDLPLQADTAVAS